MPTSRRRTRLGGAAAIAAWALSLSAACPAGSAELTIEGAQAVFRDAFRDGKGSVRFQPGTEVPNAGRVLAQLALARGQGCRTEFVIKSTGRSFFIDWTLVRLVGARLDYYDGFLDDYRSFLHVIGMRGAFMNWQAERIAGTFLDLKPFLPEDMDALEHAGEFLAAKCYNQDSGARRHGFGKRD